MQVGKASRPVGAGTTEGFSATRQRAYVALAFAAATLTFDRQHNAALVDLAIRAAWLNGSLMRLGRSWQR